MSWHIKYLPEVQADLAALSPSVRPEIIKGIRKVAQNPGYPNGLWQAVG